MSIPSAGFEPPISAIDRPQIYALDGMATAIGDHTFRINNLFYEPRLATGWTVRGSNFGGGEIFRNCPERPWDSPSLLYNE